jgi:hypothetical protein
MDPIPLPLIIGTIKQMKTKEEKNIVENEDREKKRHLI